MSNYENNLYTLPDTYSGEYEVSSLSPRDYYHRRSVGYIPVNKVADDKEYLKDLSVVNDIDSQKKKALAAKSRFYNRNINEIIPDIAAAVGYTPVVKPSFEVVAGKPGLLDRHRAYFEFTFLPCESKKVLIALPGSFSSPRAVMGEIDDYSNAYASFWAKKCWNVYSLPLTLPGKSFPRLGLSSYGIDVSKIVDLSEYIRIVHGQDAHIAIAGISRGARLAELVSLFADEIDGVISIGGSARYDFLTSEFSTSGKAKGNSWIEGISRDLDVLDLAVKLKKYVYVSVGIADAGSWGESGQSKIVSLIDMKNRLSDSLFFSYSLFRGGHEANPLQEVDGYEKLVF